MPPFQGLNAILYLSAMFLNLTCQYPFPNTRNPDKSPREYTEDNRRYSLEFDIDIDY